MKTKTTKHPDTETPETYTYCGITAPLALWREVGLTTLHWIDGTVEFPDRRQMEPKFGQGPATDGQLIEARVRSEATDERALAWLIAERRRQEEESARNRSLWTQAEAQRKASDAAIHAARIHRQAELVRAKTMGVEVDFSEL